MPSALGVLLNGLAYDSLLFLISISLSVTIGLANFINLAHGAFVTTGGCVCVVLMNRPGVPFLTTLPIVSVATTIIGFAFEYTLYRRFYRVSPLDQVLFSITLVFTAMTDATYVWGPSQQPIELPEILRG